MIDFIIPGGIFNAIAGVSTAAGFIFLGRYFNLKLNWLERQRLTLTEFLWYVLQYACYSFAAVAILFWFWGIWLEGTFIVTGVAATFVGFYFYEPGQHIDPATETVAASDYLLLPLIATTGVICLVIGVWGLIQHPPWVEITAAAGLVLAINRLYDPPRLKW